MFKSREKGANPEVFIMTTNSNTNSVLVLSQKDSSSSTLREVNIEETSGTQLTTYADATDHLLTGAEPVSSDDVWRGSSTLPDQELSKVLSRSYQLGTYYWNTSPSGTTILTNLDVAQSLFGIPQIAEKLNFFTYFRAKAIKVTVRVNSTIFHYGTLVASSTVNNSHAFHNQTGTGTWQFMNCRPVLIDATTESAVDYLIPWCANTQWVVPSAAIHLMTFRLTVAVPLSMLGSAVDPAVVTVYASFVDPEVTFPKADDLAAQSGRNMGQKEARTKSSSGTVVSDVHSFADTLFSIVGAGASAVEKLAPLLAVMADKPSTLRPVDHIVVLPGADMPFTSGLESTVRLSADPEATTGFSPGLLGDVNPNPTVQSMVRTPGYVGSFSFTDATLAGTLVGSRALSPQGQAVRTVASIWTPTPLMWYSSLFKFWRGGMKLFVHFVTSSMVTCRLRAVWIPAGHAVPATVADATSGDYVSEVFEVSGTMDYAVNIPYVSTTMYKRVASDYTLTTMLDNTSTAEEYSLGSLAFYLVAPIVSITSTLAPTVTALMWIAAAEDFQFSSYAGQLHRNGILYTYAPVIAQCSILEQFAKPFRPLVPFTAAVESGIATAESYTGLVDLGKRHSLMSLLPEQSNSTLYTNTFRWDRFLLLPGATSIPNTQAWLSAGHVNFRGSVRFKVVWFPDAASQTIIPMVRGNFDDIPGGASDVLSAGPVFVTSPLSNNFLEFETVWNTFIPFLQRASTLDVNGLNVTATLPCTNVSTTAVVGHFGYAFGDDFAFGVYQSLPIVQAAVGTASGRSKPS